MATVEKKGFFFQKTHVTHNGETTVFSGDAEVSQNNGHMCVTERGVFSDSTMCFIDKNNNGTSNSSLPEGTLVGSSKSISVYDNNGSEREFNSGIFSVNRLEKNGDKVNVIQNGIFGKKTIASLDANNVSSIASEDCSVCSELNPLYK